MKNKFIGIGLVGLFLVLFSCKSISQKKSAVVITDKNWQLTEVYGEKITDSTKFRKHPFISFSKEENRISGNSGCNSLNGTFELSEKNKIKISQLISTRMACIGVTVERQVLKSLREADSYSATNDALILLNEKGEIIAKFDLMHE